MFHKIKLTENQKTFVAGLIAIFILIAVKKSVENSYYEHWFNIRGYEFLHSLISKYDPDEVLPVIVLDISDLKLDADGAVPTKKLEEIVTALIENKAKAIAIDIDFSPRIDPAQESISTVARAEGDEEFFEFLHEQNFPVFVGVFNPGVRSVEWLGLEEDKKLAADITFIDDNTMEIPAWFQCDGSTRLYAISKALAKFSGSNPQPPNWLKGFLVDYEDKENVRKFETPDNRGNKVSCYRAFTLVNYAKLELIQKLALQTLDKDSIARAKNPNGRNKFQDKLVIIGKGQQDKATDGFFVIGRGYRSVFGVYIHATATYTLVTEPVYKLKSRVSLVLDFLLGVFVILGFLLSRRLFPQNNLSESLFIFIAISIVILVGIFLVIFFNILWLDFSLVILALLLHSKVQEGLKWISDKFISFIKNLFGKKSQEAG